MKSYLRFLGRNKLYTVIETAGLAVALAFVLILSSYIIDDLSTDRDIRNKDEILVCHNAGQLWSHSKLHETFEKIPEIESYCRFTDEGIGIDIRKDDASYYQEAMYVSENFFEFMGYSLIAGNASDVLKEKRSVVLSDTFAEKIFQDENPIGQQLAFVDKDSGNKPFLNTLTVTGVFKKPAKTTVMKHDIILNIQENRYMDDAVSESNCHANLIKVTGGTDLDELSRKIYGTAAENGYYWYAEKFAPPVMLTGFDRLDINMATSEETTFINLPDRKMARTFIVACLILLIFAILNYISLTVAFARFRSKEMATRALLGSDKASLTLRSLTESLLLTTTAFTMGAMLAMLIQKQASLLLARDIRILSNPAEIAWGAFIIALLATLTSIIPAYISSGTKPVDVIKGNARHLDKSILGKLFIGFQAALCMACISVAMTLWMQTEKMIDTPLGYHTENIVHVEGFPMNPDAELKAMPFIKRLGHLSNLPIHGKNGGRTIKLGDEKIFISSIYCDTTALSILGIDILESYKEVSPWDFLLTESTAGRLRNICSSKGIPHEQIKSRYSGVTSDIRFGNFSTSSEDFTGIMIANNLWRNPFVVEIIGDPYDAIRKIRECLEDIELDRNYSFELKINTVRDLIEDSYIKERNNFILIGIFSFLCIMLTAMAVLALSSHYAQLNTHDTAVRKVFGTSRRSVFWKTVLGFSAPVCAGALIATPITYYHIGRWLEAYTVRIPNSPIIYAAALAILLTVTVASVSVQALRLMRTNPAEVLKKE